MTTLIKSIFKRFITRNQPREFSDFFINASDKEKKIVFTNAAKLANKDQREIFERAMQHKN